MHHRVWRGSDRRRGLSRGGRVEQPGPVDRVGSRRAQVRRRVDQGLSRLERLERGVARQDEGSRGGDGRRGEAGAPRCGRRTGCPEHKDVVARVAVRRPARRHEVHLRPGVRVGGVQTVVAGCPDADHSGKRGRVLIAARGVIPRRGHEQHPACLCVGHGVGQPRAVVGAAEAHVHDADTMIGRVDQPGGDGTVGEAAAPARLDGHELRGPSERGDGGPVVGGGADHPRHRGSVPSGISVARGQRSVLQRVVARHQLAGEIGVRAVDAGIDVGHDDRRRAVRDAPRLPGPHTCVGPVDTVQVPLRRVLRVVGNVEEPTREVG